MGTPVQISVGVLQREIDSVNDHHCIMRILYIHMRKAIFASFEQWIYN